MNVREFVLTSLDLPAEWQQIGVQRMPDTISKTTVIVKHLRMERLAEAPIGHVRHEVTLSVFTPLQDTAQAEDALDDNITDLLTSIDALPDIGWLDAQKVTSPNEQNLGWDIRLTVITEKES